MSESTKSESIPSRSTVPSSFPQAVLLSRDLLFGSSALATAKAHGWELMLASNLDDAKARANLSELRLVIVELEAIGGQIETIVDEARRIAPLAKVVGYAAHVRKDVLDEANAAGFDVVMTRGQFHSGLADLFRQP